MTEFPQPWEVILTDVAEGEREALFLNIGKARGPDYARRWLTRFFFAIFDVWQGEESGRILILRIIASQTEAVSQLLGKTP